MTLDDTAAKEQRLACTAVNKQISSLRPARRWLRCGQCCSAAWFGHLHSRDVEVRPGGTTRRSDRGDARRCTQRQRTVRTCRDLQFGALLSAVRGEMEWKSGKNGLVVLNLLAIGARFG